MDYVSGMPIAGTFDFRHQQWNHYFRWADCSFARKRDFVLALLPHFIHPSSWEVAFCVFGTLQRGLIMTPVVTAKKRSKFDPKTFLSTLDGGRKIVAFPKKQTIFTQGTRPMQFCYVQKGKVKLTVVSTSGKEAMNYGLR